MAIFISDQYSTLTSRLPQFQLPSPSSLPHPFAGLSEFFSHQIMTVKLDRSIISSQMCHLQYPTSRWVLFSSTAHLLSFATSSAIAPYLRSLGYFLLTTILFSVIYTIWRERRGNCSTKPALSRESNLKAYSTVWMLYDQDILVGVVDTPRSQRPKKTREFPSPDGLIRREKRVRFIEAQDIEGGEAGWMTKLWDYLRLRILLLVRPPVWWFMS